MEKILVTGGAGFIGSHLVDKLIEQGYNVTIIDDLSTGKKENVNKNAKFIERSITENLEDIFEEGKFDYVFHLAAQMNLRRSLEDPAKDAEINILGSLNVIKNCVNYHVKKIIFSSTGGAIYSPEAVLPCREDSKIEPQSPYGLAKFTIENYLRIIKNVHGLDFVCLRYSNVYGPRQNSKGEAGVISIFIDNILEGKELIINGDGNQTRDFIFVSDVVKANVLAFDLSGIYNVSTCQESSINQIADKIKDLMDSDVKIQYKDKIKGELERSSLSFVKLEKEGWTPEFDLDSGMKQTVEWFMKNN